MTNFLRKIFGYSNPVAPPTPQIPPLPSSLNSYPRYRIVQATPGWYKAQVKLQWFSDWQYVSTTVSHSPEESETALLATDPTWENGKVIKYVDLAR